MQPKNPNGDIIAKAQYRCSTNRPTRALRTQLEQRRADGNWYPVPESIKVRAIPDSTNGEWTPANTPQVQCQNISGTKKFRTVVMITDGEGNVTDTMSNVAEWDQQCVDATDFPGPYVALVVGSNSLDVCDSVTEVLTDPNAEFTDPDVLFAHGNAEPCDGGVVTTRIVAKADAEWVIAVDGIGNNLAALPTTRSAGDGTQSTDIVLLSGNNVSDLAAITAKEEEIAAILSPDPEPLGNLSLAIVETQQVGPCQDGSLTDRISRTFRTKNTELAFGGVADGPRFKTTVKYSRLTCALWKINDVNTVRVQGTWPVKIDTARYPAARYPNTNSYLFDLTHEYFCKKVDLNESVGWTAADRWEFAPNRYFSQGFHIKSADFPTNLDPFGCTPASVHMRGFVRLLGDFR